MYYIIYFCFCSYRPISMLVLGQLMHAANNICGPPPAGIFAIVWAVARALQFTIFTLNLKVNENVTDDVNDSDACVFSSPS